ncbi:two-component system sporulation sensor kinase A [Paenibacillus phyllosphaerae]|uniref:histidine kinase n=1 Tax=Paenibacillus phyllosphaerae TaxID=274593 RepID=A0A7W5FM03_9BACL|nr:PAS domain-containing sensor histidine kinase [Paenibacillus phyllosphaerae]MBB3109484.1 two-component system sporulation sensor kinase A [Paenibacillus phyllosphaerae]
MMRRRVTYINREQALKVKDRGLINPHAILTGNMNALIDHYLTGVYICYEGRIIYVNSRLAEMFGYTQHEMRELDPLDLAFHEDRELFRIYTTQSSEVVTRQHPYWIRGLRKDGSIFFFETQSSLITYNGKPMFMGTLIDTTNLKKADDLLRENDERYQRLIKYLPEPIIVQDGDTIIYTNNAALKLLGADSHEQLLYQCFRQFVHPDYREATGERVSKVMQLDDPLEFVESKLIGMDGETIDVEASSIRIYNFLGRRNVVQTVYRDIRERKRAEEALINSEKLSVAGQMAAGIAHEIRNPLASLKGFSQLLKKKFDRHHDYLDIMLVELDRINEIVQEFMALAKPQANQLFGHYNLVRILNSVMTLLETQAILKNIELIIKQNEHHDTMIFCDENQIKQVFINLLKNAIEAMPDGGRIEIELKSVREGAISVTIKDEGIGIPMELIDKLGGPFYTTKSSGTGLGLMICNRIIQAHHGELSFASEKGAGSTVTIVLPLRTAGTPEIARAEQLQH